MKRILLVLTCYLCFCSCSKKDSENNTAPTGFSISIKQNNLLSTGQIVEKDISTLITVWNADNKDFDLNKTSDLQSGYALFLIHI